MPRKQRQVTLHENPGTVLQSITLSGASGTYTTNTINPDGTTLFTAAGTGAGWSVQLRGPRKGMVKTILCEMNATVPVTIYTHSTACAVAGTTNNTITFSTGTTGSTITAQPNRSIVLVAKSTLAWMVQSKSTAVTFAASTSPF